MSTNLPAWYFALRERAETLEKQFLPSGVDSTHDWLFNFEPPLAFAPTQAQWQEGWQAYTELLGRALALADSAVTAELAAEALADASELVLVYLNQNDPTVIEAGKLAPHVATQAQALVKLGDEPELDAFGRLIAINTLLCQQSNTRFGVHSASG